MKALVYWGPKDVRLMDRPKPEIQNDEVLIKVRYCGICGSDMTMYSGKHPRIRPGTVMGHEFVGEVVEIKTSKKTDIEIGDFVVVEPMFNCHNCFYCKTGRYNLCDDVQMCGRDVDGGFAEFVKVQLDKVIKLSKSCDLKRMALTEPLAVAVSVVNKCKLKVGDTAVVLGGGPIGLLVAQVLRYSGASSVIVSEINEYRLQKAREMGFVAVNPNEEDLKSRVQNFNKVGADVVIDCVGHPSSFETALKLVRKGGLINIVALYHDKVSVDLLQIVYSEIDLKGTFVYTYNAFRTAKDLLEKGLIDVEPFITAVYPLENVVEAFERIYRGTDDLKTLISVP
ncbi:alcohol dehydrogenase catalytic domain-containing protein [Thermovorax subterraneus]|nr:alcohol dehydrogenase catalytic domain-containing protein [Thermovorax subterraneus]